MWYVVGMSETKFANREAWLIAATDKLRATFKRAGHEIPPVAVSCGWPTNRGTGKKSIVLGTCWDGTCSADGRPQLFISPRIDNEIHFENPLNWNSENPTIEGDRMGVLPTLAHEIVHAVVGNKESHGKVFGKLARAIGLEGKLTSTHAGDTLAQECADIARLLGPYPHAKIDPSEAKTGKKKQTTRMRKCLCNDEECGFTVRTTKKWLEDVGAPHCPKHGEMKVIEPVESEDESEDE